MDKQEKIVVGIYIFLSLSVIITLTVVLSKKKKEPFKKCVCSIKGGQGGTMRVCQDSEKVKYSNLSENSDLAGIQRMNGGSQWSRVSPGDITFPVSQTCPWSNSVTNTGLNVYDRSEFNSMI